jgi:hypothetical protein
MLLFPVFAFWSITALFSIFRDLHLDSSTGGKSNTESSFDASTNNGTSNSDKRKLGEFQDLSPNTDDDNDDNDDNEIYICSYTNFFYFFPNTIP